MITREDLKKHKQEQNTARESLRAASKRAQESLDRANQDYLREHNPSYGVALKIAETLASLLERRICEFTPERSKD